MTPVRGGSNITNVLLRAAQAEGIDPQTALQMVQTAKAQLDAKAGSAGQPSPASQSPQAYEAQVIQAARQMGMTQPLPRSPSTGGVRAGDLLREARSRTASGVTPAQPNPAPAKPTYNPSGDAKKLFEAMDGMGTDEDAVFAALKGKSPEEMSALKKHYKDHYGTDLESALKDELSTDEMSRAQELLKSDHVKGAASQLNDAISGAGTNESAVFDALEGKKPDELAKIQTEYKAKTGRTLESDLRGDMGGPELDRALALLRADGASAKAAELRDAIAGAGTNENGVYSVLEGKSASERKEITSAYARMYGDGRADSLRKDLKGDLSGPELDRAEGLLDGDRPKAEAAKLKVAMTGFLGTGIGRDRAAMEEVFDGKDLETRAKVAAEYTDRYGHLGTDLQKLGSAQSEKMELLVRNGKLSDAEKLHFAMRGAGTEEATIISTLSGKSRTEINAIKDEFRSKYGKDLQSELSSELYGRDWFDTKQALRGKPTSVEDALTRMNEKYAFERDSGWGSVVDGFSDSGLVYDRNVGRANDYYKRAMADGRLNDAEKARLGEIIGFSESDVDTYRQKKDSVADGLATTAGIAVAVGTAGLGTPALLATTLSIAAGVGTKYAVKGGSYGVDDMGIDTAKAIAATGVARGAGAGLKSLRGLVGTQKVVTEAAAGEMAKRSFGAFMGTQFKEQVGDHFAERAVDGLMGVIELALR